MVSSKTEAENHFCETSLTLRNLAFFRHSARYFFPVSSLDKHLLFRTCFASAQRNIQTNLVPRVSHLTDIRLLLNFSIIFFQIAASF